MQKLQPLLWAGLVHNELLPKIRWLAVRAQLFGEHPSTQLRSSLVVLLLLRGARFELVTWRWKALYPISFSLGDVQSFHFEVFKVCWIFSDGCIWQQWTVDKKWDQTCSPEVSSLTLSTCSSTVWILKKSVTYKWCIVAEQRNVHTSL